MQHFKHLISVFTLSLLFILLGSWPSALAAGPQASTFFVVPNPTGLLPTCAQSDPCRLQMALGRAVAGDTLYLGRGVYTSTGSAVVEVTKSITLYGGWDGVAIGPIVRNPAHFSSVLNGQGARRVVHIMGNITPTLDGLYITQGNRSGNNGGGIYVQNASPIISACRIYSNTSSSGGGLYIQNGPRTQLLSNQIYSNVALHGGGGGIDLIDSPWSTLADNVIHGNAANEFGGGLSVSTSPSTTLTNNQFYDNTVNQQSGGGIYLSSSSGTMLMDNEIYRNTSRSGGGGLYLGESASVVVQHNRVYSNTALDTFSQGGGINILTDFTVTVAHNQIYQNGANSGGGLYLQGGITGTTLADNEIYGNTANIGGGIYLAFSSHVRLANNLIRSNRVISYAGGGLFLSGVDNATLLNTVVLNNQLANDSNCGSGIRFYESNASLWHTTLANNTGGTGAALCLEYSPSRAWLTNTIVANQPVGIFAGVNGTAVLDGVLWSGNQLNFDGYGQIDVTHAVTGTAAFVADGYHLMACSAAIDAGLTSDMLTDIDGETRPAAGAFDLGADEFIGGGTCHHAYLPLVLK